MFRPTSMPPLPQYEAARRAAVAQNERQTKEAERLQQDGPEAYEPGEHGAHAQMEQPEQRDNIVAFPPQRNYGGFGRWMMWVAVSLACAAVLAFILSEVDEMDSEQRRRDGRRERQYPANRYRQQRRRSYDWDGDDEEDEDEEDEDDRPRRKPQRSASRRGNGTSGRKTPPQSSGHNDDSDTGDTGGSE